MLLRSIILEFLKENDVSETGEELVLLMQTCVRYENFPHAAFCSRLQATKERST